MEAYVINLKNRTDRWERIQKDFSHVPLELKRWNAVKGADLPDDSIKDITTDFCYNFCSLAMIGCWLSHSSIWYEIIEKKLPFAIILEDDSYPIENFNTLFPTYWENIPKDWDVVYFGCGGSCDNIGFLNKYYDWITGGRKNEMINKYIFRPAFPLNMHAYAISLKGAQKLINHPALQKVDYHFDYDLAKNVYNDPDFKVYAFTDNLILPHGEMENSDIQSNAHPLLIKLSSNIPISKTMTLDTLLSLQIAQHRKTGFSINIYLGFLTIITILVATFAPLNFRIGFLVFIYILYLLELSLYSSTKVKDVGLELIYLTILMFVIGTIRQMINLN